MNENNIQIVGQIGIQTGWFEILRKSKDKVWVSCSSPGLKSIYGEIWSTFNGGDVELHSSEGFQVHFMGKRVLVVKSIDVNVTSYFFPPVAVFSNVHDKAIRCVDVSPGGGLAVSCGDDQGLFVWQTENGVIRRTLNGHINDVSHCQFFPSGVVVLSGGVDMRLRIWSVEDGSCPATLIGHTGAITSTQIIDKGRNVISCSRDGSAKLWDCGTATCLSNIATYSSIINSSCVMNYQSNQLDQILDRSDRECGTANKIFIVAREDGHLDGVDLFTRKNIFSNEFGSAVNDCCFVNENTVVAGLHDGRILYVDIRNSNAPYKVIKHGKSSVNCLKEFPGNSVLIGKADGSTSCVRETHGDDVITMELNGPECDPIHSISSHNNFVYTACRDRRIRKYRLDLNT